MLPTTTKKFDSHAHLLQATVAIFESGFSPKGPSIGSKNRRMDVGRDESRERGHRCVCVASSGLLGGIHLCRKKTRALGLLIALIV